MLEKAFGAEKAAAVLQKSVPFADGKPFEYLAEADAEKVALLLRDEGGAVRALVLSHLPAKTAAAVITGLGDAERKDVVMRLARLKTVSPDVVRRVDAAMREKVSALAVEQSDGIDGRTALTQILKQLSPGDEEAILSRLAVQDPAFGAELRERLFTGDDVLRADDRYMQGLLRTMSDGDLALLIAGKDDGFRQKILGNVSQNRAASILDEEQARKPMWRGDCERVTSQFFSTLRRAWEDGVMVIKGRDDEIYV
ncbi:MAG: flagellar motor switch protein FliG, partial [Treponemataceae bacterium]|nr:flagellar motor switch protein FliG [Treponemataceae bacterium]